MGQSESKETLPGETCKEYVARQSPSDYYLINPWVDNMAGWTEGMGSHSPFPRDGSNSPFHMDMVKGLCLGDTKAFPYYGGDPNWDKDYMEKGGIQWLTLAPGWKRTNELGHHEPLKTPTRKHSHKQEKERQKYKPIMPTSLPPPYVNVYPVIDPKKIAIMTAGLEQDNDTQWKNLFEKAQKQTDLGGPANAKQGTADDEAIPTGPKHSYDLRSNSDPKEGGGDKYQQNTWAALFPFMTIGETVVKMPLELTELNQIIKHCPKPNVVPQGAVSYLKKATRGRNYTQEDIRLIIDAILPKYSGFSWENVPLINTLMDPRTNTYTLATTEGFDEMWKELETELYRVFKVKSSLPTAVNCKHKTGESVTEFWKRFCTCWSEEAGLGKDGHYDPLLISTFINNLPPELSLLVKQQISGWTGASRVDFSNSLNEREAAGCFDIKQKKPNLVAYTDNPQHRPQHKRSADNRKCYNCGRTGHFARNCRQKPHQHDNGPQGPPMGGQRTHGQELINGAPPAPRHQINWRQQQS